MGTAKSPQARRPPNSVTSNGLEQFLPTSVQKSYFMLPKAERALLNTALEKYRAGQSGPFLVGGLKVLKPALRLMSSYRLVIDEIEDSEAITSYTRWVDAVQVRGVENQEVYLTFSPRFARIWLESKKRLLDYVAAEPANLGLRSQYALRLYNWAKKHVAIGTKRITLEQLRKVLGLESVRAHDGKIIRPAPLPVWANLRQRALDLAVAQINQKTDLSIAIQSLERSSHRRVTALILVIKDRTGSKRKT
jgi:plasmid replication initiation protein